MQYRKLGRTVLDVSVICLGTMTWGEQNSQDEAFEQIDYALDAGINFIDVAEMYPVPPQAETQGRTEEYMGNWLTASGRRDDIILASKVTGRSDMTWIRDGEQTRLSAGQVRRALETSLTRLRTDYLDLYQVHWPDRQTNFFGQLGYQHQDKDDAYDIEETLGALDDLRREGKIRHIGISNETPWGMMRYLALAEQRDLPRIASIQNPYSLLNRSFEVGLAECAEREDARLLAYSPLGFGVLSGKYLDGAQPQDARLTRWARFDRYSKPEAEPAVRAYVDLAAEHGLDPAQMALAYCNSRSFLTSTIIGATSMAQLESNIASIEIELDEDVLAAIENIHQRHPNPAP